VLNIDKYNNSTTAILLEDSNGNVVYRELVGAREKKVRKSMNVSSLPAGSYQLQIISDGEKITKTLEVSEKVTQQTITLE
jgi:hypothetical protein